MRRPSPLPPPAEPRPEARPGERGPRRGEPVDDTREAARVIPFAAPGDPRRSTGGAGTADAETDGEAPLGLRDVWRASRARRRALRAEMRRFTVRQRRRRMLWLGVLGAFAVLVAGTVGAAYSPLFAVRDIEIVGTSQLDAAAVEDALSGQLGAPIALVDPSAVKAALVQFPLVESYTLEAQPPDGLVVRIVERTPVGVIESGAGFTVVDAAGVALSTTPTAPEGLPVVEVTGGVDSDAFRSAGRVLRALPDSIRSQVTGVTASTPDDVTLQLAATDTQIVWGSAERSADKALSLETLLRSRSLDSMRTVDVSSPDAIVVG